MKTQKPLRVVLIGAGNVAQAMAERLQSQGISIVQVISKRLIKAKQLAKKLKVNAFTNQLNEIDTNGTVFIIAVSDDALPEVCNFFNQPLFKGKTIFHTAGSQPASLLKQCPGLTGVIYPLQTFTRGIAQDWSKIPIFIEANGKSAQNALLKMARLFNKRVQNINFEKRMHLHLAAVFINNFANHLLTLANDVATENGLYFKDFVPLLNQTVVKAEKIGPVKAQTGPAKRGDKKTIQKHLALLPKNSYHYKTYKLLSESIYNHPSYV